MRGLVMERKPVQKKVFGVSLDASDDTGSLQLKQAAMMAKEISDDAFFAGPYDVLVENLPDNHGFILKGQFPIPSWLGPRPLPSDRPRVNSKHFESFYENNGFLGISKQIKNFVIEKIFPATPLMIGIDHSLTGGVLSALAERYGAENISVIVLDQHFDAIPPPIRIKAYFQDKGGSNMGPYLMPFSNLGSDKYSCGSFLAYLMKEGTVMPENLLFIGVADYPKNPLNENWKRFKSAYKDFEEKGCQFFPQWLFKETYFEKLCHFVSENIKTPYVYVSLDLDVGAMNCIHAARYMDTQGISRENILDIAYVIANNVEKGTFSLVGLDVMEFNTHFLGIKTGDGIEDRTIDVVKDFILTL